jgi:DNA-binding MarR family transcriptional regulator
VNEQEVSELRIQFKRLQSRLRHEVKPVDGLSRTAMRVLSLVTRLGGAQPGQVAEELGMTSSNVAAALRELETSGFVRRERDAVDSRRVRVLVTPAGDAAVSGFRGERDTWLGRAIEATLSDDEQRLLVEAGRLIHRLAEFEPGPAGPA